MKIALTVEGTRGDVYPMLALGERLAAEGHLVRIVAPPDFRSEVEQRGFDFWPLGVSVREFLNESAAALHSRGPRFFAAIHRWGQQSLAAQFETLPQATRGMDRILAAGTILAAASAAELHAIPFRYVFYTPAMLPSLEHSPALMPIQTSSRLANRALWWITRRFIDGKLRRDLDKPRRALGLPALRDVTRHLFSESPMLATDAPLAPAPRECDFQVETIGCLHPLDDEPLPEKLEQFLRAGPPPVYLGFGSMTDPQPERTTRIMLEAVATAGCRALISEGWAGLGAAALPENVMAIGSVSHASLFPRTALVVHHGGSGTTHAAARAGVPQLVVPHVLDQFYFARRVAELGIGPRALARGRLAARRLGETLRACLDNEWMAERAQELGTRMLALAREPFDCERILAEP